MAREGLRRPLTTALRCAAAGGTIEVCRRIPVTANGQDGLFDLEVRPVEVGAHEPPLFLVSIANSPTVDPTTSPGAAGVDTGADVRVATLERDLAAAETQLLTTVGELDRSNVELRTFNEELQSVNEELQATNEELETSKEELLSVNEELATVNSELESRVVDLSRANNDMNNLLAGTGIGTVFLDRTLRVLRFTPAVTQIMHLIPSDVGRPVGHVASNLIGYSGLVEDARAVLETLAPKDVDVQTSAGAWYTMRIRPYRTLENVIEGAVITFVDISEVVHTREALKIANESARLAVVVRDAHDAITVQDMTGRILAWNAGATRVYGWTEAEALLMNVRERIPEGRRDEAIRRLVRLARADKLRPYATQRVAKDGRVVPIWLTSTALVDAAGAIYAIATTERVRRPDAAEGSDVR